MALCTAKGKHSKKPCGAQAIKGGNVCRMHGGGAPQVKKAAQLRLAALVDPAIGVLAFAMKKKTKQLGVAIQAAKEVLSYADLKDHERTNVASVTVVVRSVLTPKEEENA